MPFITVTPGGPPADQDVEDGVYPVVLVEIKDPRMIVTKDHPDGTDIMEWVFAIDDAAGDRLISGITNPNATGPKSKTYAYLTALFGRPLDVGTAVERTDLIGRRALATVVHNQNGYPRITTLTAIPRAPGITMPGASTTTTSAAPARPRVVSPQLTPISDDELGF